MSVPEHLWRFPTAEAIATLAMRFNLPNEKGMQDWEWQVADSSRIEEFLSAYENEALSEDERFTLMETIIQSFAETEMDLSIDERWGRVLKALDTNITVHIYTVWYWSELENEIDKHSWNVVQYMRTILEKYRSKYEYA